jgi:superoxide dismutase
MDKITIKWNNEMQFFEAFMPDGTKLPNCLQISIFDNFGSTEKIKAGMLTAKIEVFVKLEF